MRHINNTLAYIDFSFNPFWENKQKVVCNSDSKEMYNFTLSGRINKKINIHVYGYTNALVHCQVYDLESHNL